MWAQPLIFGAGAGLLQLVVAIERPTSATLELARIQETELREFQATRKSTRKMKHLNKNHFEKRPNPKELMIRLLSVSREALCLILVNAGQLVAVSRIPASINLNLVFVWCRIRVFV